MLNFWDAFTICFCTTCILSFLKYLVAVWAGTYDEDETLCDTELGEHP